MQQVQQDSAGQIGEVVTTKQRAAVQREVVRLLDDLAPERPPPRHDAPSPAVRQHRFPARCILQGSERAVSVSWFPEGFSDSSLGEMLVISWKGIVSLPGSAQPQRATAEALDTITLRPSETIRGWEWRAEAGAEVLTTADLASYCRDLLDH